MLLNQAMAQYGADAQLVLDGFQTQVGTQLKALEEADKTTNKRIDTLETRMTALVTKQIDAAFESQGKALGLTSWSSLIPAEKQQPFAELFENLPKQLVGKSAKEAQRLLYSGADSIAAMSNCSGKLTNNYHISKPKLFAGGALLMAAGGGLAIVGKHYYGKHYGASAS